MRQVNAIDGLIDLLVDTDEFVNERDPNPYFGLPANWDALGAIDVRLVEPDLASASEQDVIDPAEFSSDPKHMLTWPFDVSFAQPTDEKLLYAHRVRSTTPKEMRNRADHFSPKMIEFTSGYVNENGLGELVRVPFSYIGGRWVPATRVLSREKRVQELLGRFDFNFRAAQSLALSRRYEWRAQVTSRYGPSLTFTTDPIGARAMFKERDVAPGENRRAALKHWVAEHWRRRRKDEDATHYVRQHLRGRLAFWWRGYNCVVEPSAFDIEQNEKAKMAKRSA